MQTNWNKVKKMNKKIYVCVYNTFIFMHPVPINLVSLENVCHIFYAQAIRSAMTHPTGEEERGKE